MRVEKFAFVRLFAEVEVQGKRVLEEVNDKIPEHDEEWGPCRRKAKALGKHLDQCRGKHESRAYGHEVAQIAPLPVALNDDQSTDAVSERRR